MRCDFMEAGGVMKMWMIGIGATLLIIASIIAEIIEPYSLVWVVMLLVGEIVAVSYVFWVFAVYNH